MKNFDKKSLENAYRLFETDDINKFEIGTTKGLPKTFKKMYILQIWIKN